MNKTKRVFSLIAGMLMLCGMYATNCQTMTWKDICKGSMGEKWYGSTEAVSVADTLIAVQRNNGGCMKNLQYHKLSAEHCPCARAWIQRRAAVHTHVSIIMLRPRRCVFWLKFISIRNNLGSERLFCVACI